MNQFYFVSSQKMASHRSLILVPIKESNKKPLFALDLNCNKKKVRKETEQPMQSLQINLNFQRPNNQ